MAVTNKRSRSSSTGLTPQQASRKPSSKLETLLTGHRAASWCFLEGLLQTCGPRKKFLIRKGYQEEWPKSRPLQGTLWEGAASVLAQTSKAQRTSKRQILSQVTVSLFYAPRFHIYVCVLAMHMLLVYHTDYNYWIIIICRWKLPGYFGTGQALRVSQKKDYVV